MKRRCLVPFLAIFIMLAGCRVELPVTTTESAPSDAPMAAIFEPASDCGKRKPTAAQLLLEDMTLEEKIGQLFLARCPTANEPAIADIANYHLGGYILFNRDFENRDMQSAAAAIASYQAAAKIPMLIAVDEEGGTVVRVSAYTAYRSTRFPAPRTLYDQGGMDAVLTAEAEKCQLLSSLGINVNMAPVCDIAQNPNAFMYRRSLGQSPEITGDFIAKVTQLMEAHKVGSVLKHFPGYGNNADTHVGIAVDDRSLESLEANDLKPFQSGIAANCDAILVSHVMINAIDPELPATLSPAVHDYLRNSMGFGGVIVTDDLVMSAIKSQYGVEEAAVLAILAGNDLLCASDYGPQYQAVLKAAEEGRIPAEQIDAAVLRILNWKASLGLLETPQ